MTSTTRKTIMILAVFGLAMPVLGAQELPLPALIPYLTQFRLDACAAPQAAFDRNADAAAVARLRDLGNALCPMSDPSKGWQFFFGTSIAGVTSLTEQRVLTMFYNPWADVALLCEWTNPAGTPKMSGVELVMGDVLRKTKQPVMTPLWRRPGAGVPPLAIVVATSDTVKAFLDIYGKPPMFKSGDWRGKLPNMKTKIQTDLNRAAVGILFSQAQTSVNVFFTEQAFKPLHTGFMQVRQMLLDGKVAEVLAMDTETSFQSKTILTEVPLDWRRGTAVSLVADSREAFIFISDYDAPEDIACFWFVFNGDLNNPKISRIDIVGHNLSFEQVDAIARKAGVKR